MLNRINREPFTLAGPDPSLSIEYIDRNHDLTADPLVYVQTGPSSYMKLYRSKAAAFCRSRGLPVEWEEQAARQARLETERAARPKPVKGSWEELSRIGR